MTKTLAYGRSKAAFPERSRWGRGHAPAAAEPPTIANAR